MVFTPHLVKPNRLPEYGDVSEIKRVILLDNCGHRDTETVFHFRSFCFIRPILEVTNRCGVQQRGEDVEQIMSSSSSRLSVGRSGMRKLD